MVKYFLVLAALALPLGWHYRDSFTYRDAPMTVFQKRGVVFYDRWRSSSEPLVLMHYLSRHGCEFFDRTGAPQGHLSWSLCLPTPEGTVAIAEKNLLFFETTGELRWDLPASVHHDLDADVGRGELIAAERSFQSQGGQRIKVDAVSIYTFAGDRIFHWIANDWLKALAQILDRELPLQKVEEMDFYEYTHINGVQIVPSTPLKDKLEAFRPGNVLVSLNTNGLVILDRDSGSPI